MSVVLAVGSEETLKSGLPWCQRFAAQTSSAMHIAILGEDRKAFIEHVKNSLADQLAEREYSIDAVTGQPDQLLDYARRVGCHTLLIPHQDDGDDFERSVFEKSPMCAVWMRPGGPPPESAEDVLIAVSAESNAVSVAASRLLGLIPERVLTEAGDDEDSDQLLNRLDVAGDQDGRLVLFGISDLSKSNVSYAAARKLVHETGKTSIALVRSGQSMRQSLAARVKRWFARVAPPMEREQRLELANDLELGSRPNLEFLGLISAASMLSAFGLLQDSAAVIIGAMLIAPLMTPILGAGMSLAHGNRPLFRSALVTILLGFIGALTASILFGWLVWLVRPHEAEHVNWMTKEMWARCRPSPLDFCVGLVGGLAASYARTRSHLSAALAGAAIAAALVPPLSTAGLQISFGLFGKHSQGVMVVGPLLLVTINVLTIMIGSSFMLWARGMRSERSANRKDKWTLRMSALLVILTLLVLVLALDLDVIFPS